MNNRIHYFVTDRGCVSVIFRGRTERPLLRFPGGVRREEWNRYDAARQIRALRREIRATWN